MLRTTWLRCICAGLRAHLVIAVAVSIFSTRVQSAEPEAASVGSVNTMLAHCESPRGGEFTIGEAVLQVLCSNPRARRAGLSVSFQAVQIGVAQANYLPTITNTSNLLATRQGGTGATSGRTASSRFDLAWLLLDFGGRRATLTQAERLLESVRFGADATYLTIVGDVADEYFNLAAFEGLVQANRENEDAAQSSYSVAKGKFESGIGARADELQAKAAYSQAVLNRIKSEGDVAVAKGGLTSLLGIPANSPLRLTYSAELTSVRNLEQSVDGAMTDAVNAHPAIAAARAQVEAAAANVAAVRSAGLPALSLTGSIGWQRNNASGFDSSSRSRSVGLQLTVPIFEGFARESLVRAAETDVKQRENDLAEKTLEVSTDVWSNYHSFKSQAQYLVVTQELLATALKSYNIAQGRYKAGVGSIVELLNAQTALANARQQRVKSMADYRSLAIRFAASLGRLDSSLLPSP